MNNRFPYPGNMNAPWVPWDTGTGFPPFTDPNRLNNQQDQCQGMMNFNTMGRTMQPSWVYKDMSVNYGENSNRAMGMMSVNQLNMMSQNNQHMVSRNQQMLAQNQQLIGQNYQQMLNQNHQMMFPNSQQMMSHNNQQMMLNQCNRMPGPVQNNFSHSQMLNNSFTQGIRPLMSLMLPRGPIQLHNFNQSNENKTNFENADHGYTQHSSGKPPRYDMGKKQAKGKYRSKSKWRNMGPERNESNSSKASYSEELKVESVVTHKRQVTRSRSCGSGLKDWQNTGEETVTVETKETIVTRTPVHTVFEYNHHKPSRGFPTSFDDSCRYSSETDELTNPEMETRQLAEGRNREHDLDGIERSSHSFGNDNDHLPFVDEEDENSKDKSYILQDRESLDDDKNSFPSERFDREVFDDYMHQPVYEAKERSLYGNKDHQITEVNKTKAVGIIDGKYVFDQGEYEEMRSQQAEERTIVKQRNEKEMNRSLQLRDEAWNNMLKSTFEDSSTESASETVMSDSCTEVRSSLLKSILKKPFSTGCKDENKKGAVISHQTRDKTWKNSLKGFEDSSTESASETLMSDSCTNAIEGRNSLLKSTLRKPISCSYEQGNKNKSHKSPRLGDVSWENSIKKNVNKGFEDSLTESGSATPLSESSTYDYNIKKKWSRSFLKKSTSTHCEEDKYSAAPTSGETKQPSSHWLRSSYSKSAMKKFNTETRKCERKQNRKVRPSLKFDLDSLTDENNIPKTTGSNSVYKTLLEMDQRRSSAKSGRQIIDTSYGAESSPNTPVSKQVKGFSDADKCKDKQSFLNITGRVKGSMNPDNESCIPGMEHYVFSPPSNPPSRPSSPCSTGTGTSGETLETFSQNIQSSKSSSGSERKKNNQSIGYPSLSPQEPPKFWSTDYLNFVRKANSTKSTTQKQREEMNSKSKSTFSASVKPTHKWSKAERSSKLRTVLPENTNPPSDRGMSKTHLSNKENLRSIAAIRPVNAAPRVTAVTDNTLAKLNSVSFSNQTWNSSPRSKRLLSPSSFYGHKTDTSTRPHIRDNSLSTKITSTSSVGSSVKHNDLSDKVVTCNKPSKSHAVLGDKKLTITLIRGKKYSSKHHSKDNCRSIMSPVSRRTNVRTCILAGRKFSSQTASAQKPRSSGYPGRKTRSLDSSPYDAKLMKDVRVRVEDLNLSKLTQARVPRICLGERFAAQQLRMESESSSKFKAKATDEKNKETSEIHKDYSQGEEDCSNGQQESWNVSTQHEDEVSDLEEDDLANNPVLKSQEIEVTVKRKRGRPPGSKTGKRKKKTAKTRELLNSRFSSSEFERANKHKKKYGRPLGSKNKNKNIVHSTSLLTRRTSRSLRSSDKSSKQMVEMTVHEKIHSFTITKEDSHDHKISVPPQNNFHKPKVTPIKIAVPKPKETESKKNVTPLKISIVGLRNSKKDDFVSNNVPTLKMILLRKGLVTDIVLDHSDEDKQVVTPLKISGSSVTKKKIEPLKLSLKPQERMDTSSENVGNVDSETKSETETASSKLKDCESKDTNSETIVREEEVASQNTHLGTKTFSESQDMDSQEELSESIQPCENKEDLSTDTSDETLAILDRENLCGPSEIPNKAETSVLTMSEPEDQDEIVTDAENADTNCKGDTEMEDSDLTEQLNNIPSPSQEEEPGELTDNQDTSSDLGRDEDGKDSTHSAKGFKSDDNLNQVSSPEEPESLHSRKRTSSSRSTNDSTGNDDVVHDEMKDTASKKSKCSDEEEDVNEIGNTESTLDLKDYSPDNADHTIEFESDSGLDTSFNKSEDSVDRNIFDALISAAEKDDDLVQKIRKRHLRSRSVSSVANNSIQESRRSPRKRKSSDEVENLRMQKRIFKEKKREMSSKERQRYQNFQTNLRLMTKNMNPCLTKRKMVNSEKKSKQRTCESSDTSPLKQSGSEVSGLWEKTSRDKNVADKELSRKGKTASQTSRIEDVRNQSTKQKRTHECSESSDTSPRKGNTSEYENCRRQKNSSKGNNSQSTLQRGDNSNSPTTKQARNTTHRNNMVTISSSRKSSTSSSCKQATSTSQRRDSLDASTKERNSDPDIGQRRSRITFNMIKGDKLPGTNLRRRLCLYCRTFSTRLDHIMKEHVKLLHPHKCVLCKMAFKDEIETKAHRLTRHLQEVHHCLLCRKVFTSPFHYKKHVLSRAHLQLVQVQKDTLDAICRVFSQDQGDDSFSATLKKIQDQEAQLWNVRQGGKGRKALPAPGDQQPSCVQAPNLSHLKHFYYDNPELESVVRQIKDFVNSQNIGLRTRQQQQLQDQDEHFFFALPNVEDTESWTVTSESETEFSTRVTSVGNPDILDRSLSEVLGMVLSENSAQTQSSCLSEASYASVSSNRSLSSTEPLIIDTGTESSVFSDVEGHSGQFMSLLSDGALSFEDDSSEFLESPGEDLQEFLVPLQVPQISMKSAGAGSVPGNTFESVLPKPLTLPSLEPANDEDRHPLVLNCTELDDDIQKNNLDINILKSDSSEIDSLALAKSFFTSKIQDKCLDVGNSPTAEFETKQSQIEVCSQDRDDTSKTLTRKGKRISLTSLRGCTHIETTEVVSVEDLIQCQTGNIAVVEVDGGQAQEVAAETETDQESVSGFGEVDTECGALKAYDGACKKVREEIGDKILNTTSLVNMSEIPNTNDEARDNGIWHKGDKTTLKDLGSDKKTQNKKPIMDSTVEVNQGHDIEAKIESDQVCVSNGVLDAKKSDEETKAKEIMMDTKESDDHVTFTNIEEKHVESLKDGNVKTTFDNTISAESEKVSDSRFKITNDEHENIKEGTIMDISVLEEQGTNTEVSKVEQTKVMIACIDDEVETDCEQEPTENINEKGKDVGKTSVIDSTEVPSHQYVVENTQQQVGTDTQQPSCETVYGSINRPQVHEVELGTSSISSDESDKFCESAQIGQMKAIFENDPFCSGRKNRKETGLEILDTQVGSEVHQNTQNENMVDTKTPLIPKENSNVLDKPEFIELEMKAKNVTSTEINDDSTEQSLIENIGPEKEVTEMIENKVQVNMAGSSTLSGNNSQETSSEDPETAAGLMVLVSVSGNMCENGQTEKLCEKEETECCGEEMTDGKGAEVEKGFSEEKCFENGQNQKLFHNEEMKCEQKKKDGNGADLETDFSADKKLGKEHGVTELSEDSASSTIEGISFESEPVKEMYKESDSLTSVIVRTSFEDESVKGITKDTDCSLFAKEGTRFESVAIKDIYKETDSASSIIEGTSFDDEFVKGINKETVSEPSVTPRTFEGDPLNAYCAKDVVLCQPNLSDSESQEVFPDTRTAETQFKDEVEDMLRELVNHTSSSTGGKPS